MIVLAVDTSTPTVTAGVVRVATTPVTNDTRDADATAGPGSAAPAPSHQLELLAEHTVTDPFAHAEQLMPLAVRALAEAGLRSADLDAVVVGLGPGPFTGLRVGIATAAALGDALEVPVYGVPSHDAVAALAVAAGPVAGDFLVVTDARRREVYLSGYRPDGSRWAGPVVLAPGLVAGFLIEHDLRPGLLFGAGAPLLRAVPEWSTIPVGVVRGSVSAGLVGCARAELDRPEHRPGPLVPLYLRRPDATEPAARKSVLTS